MIMIVCCSCPKMIDLKHIVTEESYIIILFSKFFETRKATDKRLIQTERKRNYCVQYRIWLRSRSLASPSHLEPWCWWPAKPWQPYPGWSSWGQFWPSRRHRQRIARRLWPSPWARACKSEEVWGQNHQELRKQSFAQIQGLVSRHLCAFRRPLWWPQHERTGKWEWTTDIFKRFANEIVRTPMTAPVPHFSCQFKNGAFGCRSPAILCSFQWVLQLLDRRGAHCEYRLRTWCVVVRLEQIWITSNASESSEKPVRFLFWFKSSSKKKSSVFISFCRVVFDLTIVCCCCVLKINRHRLFQVCWFMKIYTIARGIWPNCPDKTGLSRDKRNAHWQLTDMTCRLYQLMDDMDIMWNRRWLTENDWNGVVDNMHRFMVDTFPIKVATPISYRFSKKLWNGKYGYSTAKVYLYIYR